MRRRGRRGRQRKTRREVASPIVHAICLQSVMHSCCLRVSVVVLCLLTFAQAGFAASPKRKVIIDQDAFGPGGPNLQPILMVLQSPDVEVLGITIESGDGWQKENVAHTLR